MSNNGFTPYTFPQAQTQSPRRKRAPINFRLKHRQLYGKPRCKNAGKELDPETGLYYYGARYLDPKTSRWISGDPALGDYLPVAPVDDEARKRNSSLPGQGGVFNLVNLHVYHYAGNNPVRYVDPTGKFGENLTEEQWTDVKLAKDTTVFHLDSMIKEIDDKNNFQGTTE